MQCCSSGDCSKCGCCSNVKGMVMIIIAALPALILGQWALSNPDCKEYTENKYVHYLCETGVESPLEFVNAVSLLSMVFLWLLSLFQGNCWLIDFYWTVIPVMIALFYKLHPSSSAQWAFPSEHSSDMCGCVMEVISNIQRNFENPQHLRSNASMAMLLLWAGRLTASYLRREFVTGTLGHKEDWRFTDMRRSMGRVQWAICSLFYAYLSQHVLLVGITLPFYVIHHDKALSNIPFGMSDLMILAVALFGIVFAYRADNELFDFTQAVKGRSLLNLKSNSILNTGLWAYSRHPNYFGEAVWWGALSVGYGSFIQHFAHVSCNDTPCWIIGGWAINTLVMVISARMIETRMTTARAGSASTYTEGDAIPRHQGYKYYREYTSFIIPWANSKESYLRSVNKKR